MTYKTPDVYVEEISIFPPSVAEVATAIPAFIGYTEKFEHKGISYQHKAKEIKSLVEFEEYFGKGPKLDVTEVKIDGLNQPTEVKLNSSYYLYDSLKLYFTNGGGRCYIFSCDVYQNNGTVKKSDFDECIKSLKKEDEPTMIVFPDATNLTTESQFYQLQKDALSQAGKLMDRVVIMDLLTDAENKGKVGDFRQNIGMQNLKYGAAYTPYLKTAFTKTVRYKDFYTKVTKGGAAFDFKLLNINDDKILDTLILIEELYAASDLMKDFKASTLKANYALNAASVKTATNSISSKHRDLLDEIFSALKDLEDVATRDISTVTLNEAGATLSPKNNLTMIARGLLPSIATDLDLLNQYNIEARTDIGEDGSSGLFADEDIDWTATLAWGSDLSTPSGSSDVIDGSEPSVGVKNSSLIDAAAPIIQKILSVYQEIEVSAKELENSLENSIYENISVIKNISSKIATSESIIPPSGAMAGIYAQVDSSRGVWKAPANVSVSGVIGVTEKIDSVDQETLNVDVDAGKSINAIREFAGKGTLVWGARTLAGNDNEWRYVPVRRFFNMVEESVKKSTYWAVFEPNDANLWIKLKSMIENYLTQKWREGALAGAKPEQAFYVNIGLGKTMTAQDILEGRLIIDIGMAAVRPAEFIILRFMHKMQEA